MKFSEWMILLGYLIGSFAAMAFLFWLFLRVK